MRKRLERCLLILCLALAPSAAVAWYGEPGYIPLRRDLPNGIDMLESSLYWLQDLSGVDDPRDPAAVISLMEDQAARFFDFSYISYLVAGPAYTRMNALARSHFQNRVRDALFTLLAREMGMFNNRMPRFRPLLPVRNGYSTWVAGGEILHPGGPYVRLQFYFYPSSNGWRIYDVTSNGMSAISWLRRQHLSR